MSAAATSFGPEFRIPGSVRLNHSVPRVDADVLDGTVIRETGEGNDLDLCYEAACEADLVSAAQNGDQHAFVELCRRHSPSLKRRIRKILRNREDAEDILQDTLVRAFTHLTGFRATCSFATWIMTIATNSSFMLLRKRRNHPETGFGIVTAEGKEFEVFQLRDPMPNPEQAYAKRQASRKVSEAVRILPPVFRVVVERYYRDEVKLADAANEIGITPAAAKSRLLRARTALRRNLNNDRRRNVN